MEFQFVPFEPPAALAPCLRRSFFARGRIGYRSDKILPNGLAAAVFTLGGPHRVGPAAADNPSYAHGWLSGVQTAPLYNAPSGETHALGLVFEPIGLHALFGTDMRRLADRTVDARTVLPPDFVATVDAMTPQAETADAHAALHAALLARPAKAVPAWLRTIYDRIAASRGMVRLADAYAAAGRSPRHINAAFKTAVGVSPKTLCRIRRLGALLEAIDPSGPVDWTALAHAHGFYDQAHFNRDFRQFSGLWPSRYLERRRRDLPALGKGESVHFAPQR